MSWRNASVQTKLTVVTMVTCVAALLMASLGVITYELANAKDDLTSHLAGVADLIGASSTAAIQFDDGRAGTEALTALRKDADIESARIDLRDGTPFASYAPHRSRIPVRAQVDGVEGAGSILIVSRPIELDGRQIGAIHIQGSLDGAYSDVRHYVLILGVVLALSLVVAYLLSRALQGVISGPILRLASTASRVSVDRDYSVRAVKEGHDELGLLVERFNDMLTQIERRDAALSEAHEELEARVLDRTGTLELEILEHRRTENQLAIAKAAAEEASVAKSAFLANMSHELRTPLNAIIGYSEMLIEDAQDDGATSRVADLSKVVGAGRHLLALITDVLDLSKIEAGRMDLHVESFDVAALIAGAVSTSQTLASARGNVVTAGGLAHLGTARGDQTKVQQVLLNLLSNACKFTSHGTVRVEARREAGSGADWIVIDVIDTGIGMTLEQTKRIFHEFTQADASTTRRYGGTGLGLAISQRLCHLMGGSLTVESAFAQGSTFTARIPAEMVIATAPPTVRRQFTPLDETAAPLAVPSLARQPDADTGPTVLIIDDDAGARELMTRMLHKGGFRPIIASSAETGLQLLRDVTPDAVVLDVLLPDATGWSLLEELKADPLLQRIPVVVLSVLENRGLSLALGAVDHIIKPVSADRLLSLLRTATVRSSHPTPKAPQLDTVSAGVPAGAPLETEEQ